METWCVALEATLPDAAVLYLLDIMLILRHRTRLLLRL